MVKKLIATNDSIYQLKITLNGLEPPIWRRLLVPSGITLDALHDVIQVAMGWENDHLFAFRIRRQEYDDPGCAVRDIAPRKGSKFQYIYDFGDSWRHDIVVERILEPNPEAEYPDCVAGARACPPEDCGGTWGYEEILEALSDPDHPDYEYFMDRFENFDPERFDLGAVSARLKKMGKRRSSKK